MTGRMRLFSATQFQLLLFFFSLHFIPYLAIVAETPHKCPTHHHNSSCSHVIDIVQDVCNLTWPSPDDKPMYNSCVATLQSVPETHNASLPNLAIISTRIAITNAANLMSYVQNLTRFGGGQDRNTGCLATCLWLYGDSIAGMEISIRQIREGLYGNASASLSAILDDVFGCRLCFQGSGTEDPLMEKNTELYNIVRISATISYKLARAHLNVFL